MDQFEDVVGEGCCGKERHPRGWRSVDRCNLDCAVEAVPERMYERRKIIGY
jgi:hypothetical protein